MRWLLVSMIIFVQSLGAQITIQGTVTRSGSQPAPVADATVEITRLEIGVSDTVRSPLGSVRTDVNGRYSFQFTTDVRQNDPGVPQSFALSDAYPNPFNAGTQWDMGVHASQDYSIAIYNILGQKLAGVRQVLPLGSYTVHWDGADIPGIYFASIRGGGKTTVVKLIQMMRHRGATALRIIPGARLLLPKISESRNAASASLLQVTVESAGYHTYRSGPLSFAGQSVNVALNYLGTIFSAKRDSALNRSGAHFTELTKGMPKLDAARAMAEWLRTQPDIEAAGAADDGNAWARFSDGPIIIFVNNTGRSDTSLPHPKRAMLPKTSPLSPPRADGVPGTNKIITGNAFGVTFGNASDYAAYLAETVGYKQSDVSRVYQLKGMKDAGIFYFFGHGGYGEVPGGGTEYAIWTASQRTPANDALYADDLYEHRLVWMYGAHDWESRPATAVVETSMTKYAFTGQFVRKYMTFAPNSLVFIASCSSAKNNAFVNAFFAKGASLFAGFTDTWYSDYLNYSSDIFFDRTLGTSAEDLLPETPPQRGFNGPDVLAWMHSKDLDKGSADGSSRLILVPASGAEKPADPLAPSIATMFVHPYEQKLYIYGNFGDNTGSDGTVTIGGMPSDIFQWGYDSQAQMDMIICRIPDAGAGSFGDVQVTARKIKSNVTQLSRYKGDFTLIHETTDGRQYEVKLTLQFRVHLLGFRMKPGEKPLFNQNTYVVDADMGSTGEYTASGVTGGAVVWSGHATGLHNNIDGASSPTSFIAGAWFDPEQLKMQLYLSGGIKDGIIQTAGTISTPIHIIFGLDEFDGKKPNFPSYAEIPLNADFSISKNSVSAKKVGIYFSMLLPFADKVRIEWGDIACEAKPDPKARR